MIGCMATGVFADATAGSDKGNVLLLYSLPDLYLLQGKHSLIFIFTHLLIFCSVFPCFVSLLIKFTYEMIFYRHGFSLCDIIDAQPFCLYQLGIFVESKSLTACTLILSTLLLNEILKSKISFHGMYLS